jgi:hypothetical protein
MYSGSGSTKLSSTTLILTNKKSRTEKILNSECAPLTMYLLSDDETRARVHDMGMRGGGGVNTSQREWGVGELEFEALMRMLDNSVPNTYILLFFIMIIYKQKICK